uniref:Zinc-ribbon containing domain protein n=1 Tax=Siphoviridae sp. ct0Go27 TaxID=2827761 RepID=A0A8S5RWB1_9CAUD|nr:MAG TPA: zinc-ribbon containing domain protein [Siphoviridae sp. ct0Go27]
MKLKKETGQLINCYLLMEFFRENAIPDLKDILPEIADSVYEVEEKLEEFSEMIEKKAIEAAEKEVDELTKMTEEERKELKYRTPRKIAMASDEDGWKTCVCPTCREELDDVNTFGYCFNCGQKLDWEGVFDD